MCPKPAAPAVLVLALLRLVVIRLTAVATSTGNVPNIVPVALPQLTTTLKRKWQWRPLVLVAPEFPALKNGDPNRKCPYSSYWGGGGGVL